MFMQLVKYLKYSTGDFDLMLFLVVYHEPPMSPKANLLYCIVFLCYISSMHELATHKSLFCSLYPAKLTLTWYSPLFK